MSLTLLIGHTHEFTPAPSPSQRGALFAIQAQHRAFAPQPNWSFNRTSTSFAGSLLLTLALGLHLDLAEMSAITEIERARHLCHLLLKLHSFMTAEQEGNWIRGVSNVIAILQEAEENPSEAKSLLLEARQSYRSMNGGNGSLSDFHIWRHDFEERVQANRQLEETLNAIWQEFEVPV